MLAGVGRRRRGGSRIWGRLGWGSRLGQRRSLLLLARTF